MLTNFQGLDKNRKESWKFCYKSVEIEYSKTDVE